MLIWFDSCTSVVWVDRSSSSDSAKEKKSEPTHLEKKLKDKLKRTMKELIEAERRAQTVRMSLDRSPFHGAC